MPRSRPRADFRATLAARFRPPGDDVDVAFCLVAGGERLASLKVAGGELRWNPPEPPDATFFFDSAATALALLGGGGDPMAAFSAGRFRSDGNLPLAFVLLGLFRADYGGGPPS